MSFARSSGDPSSVASSSLRILTGCRLLATPSDDGVRRIDQPALVWKARGEDGAEAHAGEILWVGAETELGENFSSEVLAAAERIDGGGALVVPGLVDCHTHLAFGGSRAGEFERRVLGASYLEIAREGGGIQSTVAATRAAGEEQLRARAAGYLERMCRLGVTTVECKSGYGLSVDSELELLRVYRSLAESQPVRVVSTFLGAHVPGPEYRARSEDYVDLVCEAMIPRVAAESLASFCDVFVEEGAFSADQARRILRRAADHGLGAKLHVDQLHDSAGGELAAEVGAVSADHLEHVSERGIAAMAEAGVVAVSLPFASFFLRQPSMPARKLLEAGVPVAVATDFNPGSAPSYHLPLAMLLASVLQSMSADEVLEGVTSSAAKAIGLDHRVGSLEPGKVADFVLVAAPSLEDWLFTFEPNRAVSTWIGGRRVTQA